MSDTLTWWQIIKNITIDKDIILWIAGTVIAIVTALGVFIGPLIAQKRQERIRKNNEKLSTHFQDLKSEVIDTLIFVTNDIESMGEVVLYQNWPMTVERPTTFPNYTFEQSEAFNCFKIHFPEIVTEWERLKEKAISHDKNIKDSAVQENRKKFIDTSENIVRDFRRFASELDTCIDNIAKYEMGKSFKKHKKCPICKKF